VTDLLDAALGLAVGVLSSSFFVLALVIGFCVLAGFVKRKRTAGAAASPRVSTSA
jgi:hypothetical protein